MANQKVTDLAALTTPADGDILYIVDVSDTSGGAAGTSKKIVKSNLVSGGDDHFVVNGGGFVSTSAEMAVSWGMSTSDSSLFNYITTFLVPIDCRVVNVITQSQSNGGSTDISVYKPTAYNQSVSIAPQLGSSVNIPSHNLGTVYTSTFDTSTFDFVAGDRLGVTVDSSTNLNGLSLTLLLKKI